MLPVESRRVASASKKLSPPDDPSAFFIFLYLFNPPLYRPRPQLLPLVAEYTTEEPGLAIFSLGEFLTGWKRKDGQEPDLGVVPRLPAQRDQNR